MKKSIATTLVLTFAFLSGYAQDNWPELKAFHTVMSQTFHPSEEGNLKPIKERCGEMVEKAEALQKSKIPSEYNTEKIKPVVDNLVTSSKELQTMIKKKEKDEAISKKLTALHDTFHEIVGLCKKDDGYHDHNHGDHQH
jgi:hypothetical protein